MHIEEFGAPLPSESPERKYASLHRTIEAGSATDRTWSDLVHCCLLLHKYDEALTAAGHIDDPGLVERANKLLRKANAHAQQRCTPASSLTRSETARRVQKSMEVDPISENVVDSFRFLFTEQMPLIVIFATLTFPLVVGLGGFLTQDSHALVFPLLAMIPALSVVGLIGALGRQIMLDASRGLDDPPTIPALPTLFRNAGRFLVDSTLLGLVFLAPGFALMQVDIVSGWAVAGTLALGVFLLPMAMAIRQVSDDFRALSPNVLFPAIVSTGTRYCAFAGCFAVLFAPAGVSAYYSAGSAIYLQVSVVGPLLVAPLFIVARLLGVLLFTHRRDLADVLGERVAPAPAAPAKPAPRQQQQAPAPRAKLGSPQHVETRATANAQPTPRRAPPSSHLPKVKNQPGRRLAQTPPAQPTPGLPARAKTPPAPAAPRVEIEEVSTESAPANQQGLPDDILKLAGACVVSGADRERAGASASGSSVHRRRR